MVATAHQPRTCGLPAQADACWGGQLWGNCIIKKCCIQLAKIAKCKGDLKAKYVSQRPSLTASNASFLFYLQWFSDSDLAVCFAK